MAHFAKIGLDNIVTNILVISDEDIIDENGNELEKFGIEFCEKLTGHETWKQCSYNSNFRGHYPAIGDRYDSALDIFKQSSPPYESWTLNTTTGFYEPPIPYPITQEEAKSISDNGGNVPKYIWDEPTTQWVEIG
jgi:hypothetical protein